jgi:hypothetical protein
MIICDYMKNEELIPKGDGTFYVPIRKRVDETEYVPAEYKNVDKWCTCNGKNTYCIDWTKNHEVHICVYCNAVLPYHIVPFQKLQ